MRLIIAAGSHLFCKALALGEKFDAAPAQDPVLIHDMTKFLTRAESDQ
jgi:hypothetical protein